MRRALFVTLIGVVGLIAAGCVMPPPPAPDPEPGMLAVAYSNLDGADGYDPTGTDVLIAKLMDTNLDGVVSAGDTIVTNQYPLDLGGTGFGAFQTTTHEVATVVVAEPQTARVSVLDSSGSGFAFNQESSAEQYLERVDAGFRSQFVDYLTARPALERVEAMPQSPSAPQTEVPAATRPADAVDDPFLDVDIFI